MQFMHKFNFNACSKQTRPLITLLRITFPPTHIFPSVSEVLTFSNLVKIFPIKPFRERILFLQLPLD